MKIFESKYNVKYNIRKYIIKYSKNLAKNTNKKIVDLGTKLKHFENHYGNYIDDIDNKVCQLQKIEINVTGMSIAKNPINVS